MIVRSTGKVPAPGFGLASEPIALWGESAPKSLLGAAPPPYPPPPGGLFPPPYPPPPPQAASPSTEDSIAETKSSLRFGIMLLLSGKTRSTGAAAQHTRLIARAAASFRR